MFDIETHETIPTNLDNLEAGLELGGVLACIDVIDVAPDDRITVLRNEQRMESYYRARKYHTMAAVVAVMEDVLPEYRFESAAAEIGAALRLTRRASEIEVAFALELERRLPAVWEALVRGTIDIRRAKTFSRCTAHLKDHVARHVVDRVIDYAGRLTTGQLKARLDRVTMEIDPDSARDRYTHRVKDSRVVLEATDAGTANLLGLDLTTERAVLASRRMNQIALSLNTKDEPRTMDQLRADVYLDLLLGELTPNNAVMHLHTDLDTLTALAAHPGELNGYGPVVADIARQVTQDHEDAEWRYAVTNNKATSSTKAPPTGVPTPSPAAK